MGWAAAAAQVAASVYGAIQQNNQNKANQAYLNTTENDQGQALAQAGSLAKQEAQGEPFQTLLDVQKGGIQTLKSQVGGIPNEGMAIKQLFGGATENALETGVNTRDAQLNSAIATELGIGQQYGSLAGAALGRPQSPSAVPGALNSIGGLFAPGGPFGGGSGTPSGGLDTSMLPSPGTGTLALPPDAIDTSLPLPAGPFSIS